MSALILRNTTRAFSANAVQRARVFHLAVEKLQSCPQFVGVPELGYTYKIIIEKDI